MRRWIESNGTLYCGSCSDAMPVGAAALEMSGAGWKKYRCSRCADEPVPEVLSQRAAALENDGPRFAARVLDIAKAKRGELQRDFKIAQGGE